MPTPMPECVRDMVVQDAAEVEKIAAQVDFIFCAVNMPKNEIKALEEAYAKAVRQAILSHDIVDYVNMTDSRFACTKL